MIYCKTNKWISFWQNYRLIEIKDERDLLYQVGKTVNKKPISKKEISIIIDSIVENLDLSQNDTLLDLCCGNGVLTYELSHYVKKVIGIDFSKPFIENSKLYKQGKNIEYICQDALRMRELKKLKEYDISKVLLYDALAYFDLKQLEKILCNLFDICKKNEKVFLGSVLYRDFKWKFFNSWKRILNYYINIKIFKNHKGLGTWWSSKDIKLLSNKFGFNYKIKLQDKRLYTAHYRVDILIEKSR